MSGQTCYSPAQDKYISENVDLKTFAAIGAELNLTRNQVRGRWLWISRNSGAVKNSSKNSVSPNTNFKATGRSCTVENSGDNDQVVTSVDDRIRTVEDLIISRKIDLTIWKIANATVGQHEGFFRDKSFATAGANNSKHWNRSAKVVQLYSVKIWLKRIDADQKATDNLREKLISEMDEHSPKKYRPISRMLPKVPERIMGEISIPDHHFAKMCWNPETQFGNYDLKIAESMYVAAVADLLKKLKAYPLESILFPIGNDMLHVDGKENQTTHGTPQDVDGRWQKSFLVAKRAIIKAIDMCREVAPVKVIVVPGNHDQERIFYLGDSISSHYRLVDEVTVDNSPCPIKFVEYGKTLLGFAHGDSISEGDLPMLMAGSNPAAFARTTHWEWHLGHRHTRSHRSYAPKTTKLKASSHVQVTQGVHVRILPALCPPDAWHAKNGYVLTPRASEAYIWQHDVGYGGHLVHTPRLE